MTPPELSYWQGIMQAARAAAALARAARRAGQGGRFTVYANKAASLYEEARIARKDIEAFSDLVERGVQASIAREQEKAELLQRCMNEAEDTVLRAQLSLELEQRQAGALPRGQRPKWAQKLKRVA